MQEFDYKKERESDNGDEVFSKPVRAGRRTYFFDVKATRNDDYYLTITESRKKLVSGGTSTFEKHKLFLYKEDFKKFSEGFESAVEFIKKNKPDFFENEQDWSKSMESESKNSTDIEFESL